MRFLFLLYVGLMLWLLFGQRFQGELAFAQVQQMLEKISLKPGHTIGSYLWVLKNSADPQMRREAVINLVGNVVMFVPLGFFLGALFRPMGSFWRMLLCSIGIICLVELLQIITLLGSCDIDDLILNLPGTMLGWGIWKCMDKSKNKK